VPPLDQYRACVDCRAWMTWWQRCECGVYGADIGAPCPSSGKVLAGEALALGDLVRLDSPGVVRACMVGAHAVVARAAEAGAPVLLVGVGRR